MAAELWRARCLLIQAMRPWRGRSEPMASAWRSWRTSRGAIERALANAPALVDVVTSQTVVSSDATKGLGFVPEFQPLTVWDDLETQWPRFGVKPLGRVASLLIALTPRDWRSLFRLRGPKAHHDKTFADKVPRATAALVKEAVGHFNGAVVQRL